MKPLPGDGPDDPAVLTPEGWRRVKAIAAEALDRPAADRGGYVATACGQDQRLLSEVQSLLDATEAAARRFETGTGGLASVAFNVPPSLGPYRILRELATGGMGSVYLAERSDGQYEQTVAIKIARGGGGNPFLLRRFLEERRILATLDHPNIARLLDGGTTDAGLPYVVMEFVQGEPVDAYCDREGLDTSGRLALFLEVCGAVQYAHQRLVIHRDIKPSNILVNAAGRPKLLDFGIAKLLDAPGGTVSQAVTAIRVLTPESASPEQLTGSPLTIATDIYALGVLLYRLLTGQSPYGGTFASETELFRAITERIPDAPSRVSSRPLDRELDTIVLKALAKEPERRYASVDHFAEDIRRYQKGLPVLAVPDGAAYRARKFVNRHRLAMAASLALLLTMAGGVAATVWQARRAEAARQRAQEQFDAVRALAGAVLGELHDAVALLPGSTPAREILVRRATAYLDALAQHAPSDETLRVEVAYGYLRLATIQGFDGLPNLGDRQAARRSVERALALLNTPPGEPSSSAARLGLARAHAVLAQMTSVDAEREANLDRAEAALEASTDEDRQSVQGLGVAMLLSFTRGNQLIAQKRYAEAEPSYRRYFEAAEALWRIDPDNLDASRNLSLACKYLGGLLEVLDRRKESIPLYRRAMELDQGRVAREPKRPLWQLDLSFAHGSLGAALMGSGDNDGALREYERAVELRAAVVAADPQEDFAKGALARGYERLATIHGRIGDLSRALDASSRRVAVYRERLAEHPERDHFWGEFTAAAFSAAQTQLRWAEERKADPAARTALEHAKRLLDEIERTQARWRSRGGTAALPPDAESFGKARGLQRRLGVR